MRIIMSLFIAGCFLAGGCCGNKETTKQDEEKKIEKTKAEAEEGFKELDNEKTKN